MTTPNQFGAPPGYNFKGSSYNAYIAAGYFDNDFSNELLVPDDVLEAEIKFRDMTDPDTNTRILVQPNTVLLNREKSYLGRVLFGASAGQYRTAPGATTGLQTVVAGGPNPVTQYTVIESPLVFERLTASDGLNLSATNAGKYWYLFESGTRTHVYVQNWPMRTQSAAAGNVDMIDRGVVMFTKADERGVPMWKEPRRVVRNKN